MTVIAVLLAAGVLVWWMTQQSSVPRERVDYPSDEQLSDEGTVVVNHMHGSGKKTATPGAFGGLDELVVDPQYAHAAEM